MKVVSRYKRAKYDYEILEEFQAGISLLGSEIKSIRNNNVTIEGGYVSVKGNIATLKNINISKFSGSDPHDPTRDRQLLLHKREIRKLNSLTQEKGFTVIPIALGISKSGYAKVDIAIAKSKTKADKRQTIKNKDFQKIKKDLLG